VAPPSVDRPVLAPGGAGYICQVVEIVRQVAGAAHALHEAGVVHRDIKPGNIMLTAEDTHPVLMDLGLAQVADEADGRLTRTRQFIGTLRYASPEQVLAAGRVDRRTDIYSLGATLWELLTLRPIFGAGEDTPTPELMLRIQTSDPEKPRKHNKHVPRDLEAIVLKCLDKDRDRRYATAADLATDLRRFLVGEPVSAQPPSLSYLTGKLVRRYRVPLAAAALVLLLLLAGAVAAFIGIDQERRAALDAKGELEKTNDKLQETNTKLGESNERMEEQLYANRIAVAERELALNNDVGLAATLLEQCPERLRGWEWDYLMRLRDGPRPPLQGGDEGHKGGLWRAVFSPDGRRVVTASIDGTAKVWDIATGRVLVTFHGHEIKIPGTQIAAPGAPRVPIMCVAFSPDGRYVASGGLAPKDLGLTALTDTKQLFDPRKMIGVVKVWDAKTGKEAVVFDQQIGLVDFLAYSPDGTRIASSSIGEDNSVAVWDVRTGKDVRFVRGYPTHVHRVCFSPDGRLLVTGSTDGIVRFWDATTLEKVRTIEAHPAPVYDLAFSVDGSRLGSAGVDGTVCVWETATGSRLLTLRGHTGAAMGVAFGPDGLRIATAGFDKTVRLWDARTGEEKITLRGHNELVASVVFSPDGRQLLSAGFDKVARIWDASPSPEPTGPGLFTVGGHADRVNAVAFSRDGRLLATAGGDGTVRLWDGQTGEALHTLKGHQFAVFGVGFTPDGTRVASAGWDRSVRVWDTRTGREILTISGHTTPIQGMAMSPDGKRLASCSYEGLVKIWDTDTGKETATCAGHVFPAVAVAFSPDGKRLASGSGDRTIKIWDVERGREIITLKGHNALVSCVAFSPDGQRVASSSWDQTAKVWDVKTGKELRTLKDHTDRVLAVAFSPDGKWLATGAEDKTLRVWNAATGEEIVAARRYPHGIVWAVAWSPDGKRVVTGCWSASNQVRTWNVAVAGQGK
jgi:WD40 repeat protein